MLAESHMTSGVLQAADRIGEHVGERGSPQELLSRLQSPEHEFSRDPGCSKALSELQVTSQNLLDTVIRPYILPRSAFEEGAVFSRHSFRTRSSDERKAMSHRPAILHHKALEGIPGRSTCIVEHDNAHSGDGSLRLESRKLARFCSSCWT